MSEFRRSYKDPHPASKLSFFIRGFEWLDAVSVSPKFSLLPTMPGADRDTAYAIEQNNAYYEIVKTQIRQELTEELGIPESLKTPIVSTHIGRVVNERLMLLALSNQLLEQQTNNGGLPAYVSLQTRIINAYLHSFHGLDDQVSKNRRYTRTAADLNMGIPRKSENQGLTADHIRRSDARFLQECLSASKELRCGKSLFLEVFKAMIWRDKLMVRALNELWKQAKQHELFKHRSGYDLADAIHYYKGVQQCVDWWLERNRAQIRYA